MPCLNIVMRNNLFSFGDTFWLQKSGTAMGTPPAPDYATLFFAIHEEDFLPKFPQLSFYRRFLDDVFSTWVPLPSNSADEDLRAW